MKRRQLLATASVVALSCLSSKAHAGAVPGFARFDASSASLVPLRMARGVAPGRALQAVQIGPAYVDEGARGVASLALDLGVLVGREEVHIHAWQMTRRADGGVSQSSRITLPFVEGQAVDLHVIIRGGDDGKGTAHAATWRASLSSGLVYALATRRRSTGLPPLPSDFAWDTDAGLRVADRHGLDFDAVLITTV